MAAVGTARRFAAVLESAKWAKVDIDQVAVTEFAGFITQSRRSGLETNAS